MIVHVVGVTATVLAAVFLIPQIVRVIVRRDARGVSVTWAAFGVITNAAWVLYLASVGLWVPALAPILAVGTYGLLLGVVGRIDDDHDWTWCLVYAGMLLATVSLGGPGLVGAVLAATPGVQLAPEVVAIHRHRHPTGVSPLTWTLGMGEAVCWAAYGYRVGEGALLGYGLVTSLGSALILARWWRTCRRLPAPATPRARVRSEDVAPVEAY